MSLVTLNSRAYENSFTKKNKLYIAAMMRNVVVSISDDR